MRICSFPSSSFARREAGAWERCERKANRTGENILCFLAEVLSVIEVTQIRVGCVVKMLNPVLPQISSP